MFGLRDIVFWCFVFEVRYLDIFYVKVFLSKACVGFADAVFIAVRFCA